MSYRHHLWRPLTDALKRRGAASGQLQHHAWTFLGAQYQATKDQASANALGFAKDPAWPLRHSLSAALDRRDDWLCVLGQIHRLSDEVAVTGHWPTTPFIALGTHWGAGMPTLAHLAMAGKKPVFVYRQQPESVFSNHAQRIAHGVHLKAIKTLGGAISLGGAYSQIMDALANHATPVILMDAPAEGRPTIEGQCGDFCLQLRLGLLQMLCRESIPYVFYRCGFDPQTHRRELVIGPMQQAHSPEEIAYQAAAHLHQALVLDAAQWRLWMVASSLIRRASV